MTQLSDAATRLLRSIKALSPSKSKGRVTKSFSRSVAKSHEVLAERGVNVLQLLDDARTIKREADRVAAAEKRVAAARPDGLTQGRVGHAVAPIVSTPVGKSGTAHLMQWPIDRAASILTAGEYDAAQRLRDAYFGRNAHPRVPSFGGGGGGGGSSHGSHLPVGPHQERAGREFNAAWTRLGPALRAIVRNFVFEEAPSGSERPMTAEEFGMRYGRTTDARRARGVADGAIKTACAALATIWAEYDIWRHEQKMDATARALRNTKQGDAKGA